MCQRMVIFFSTPQHVMEHATILFYSIPLYKKLKGTHAYIIHHNDLKYIYVHEPYQRGQWVISHRDLLCNRHHICRHSNL